MTLVFMTVSKETPRQPDPVIVSRDESPLCCKVTAFNDYLFLVPLYPFLKEKK